MSLPGRHMLLIGDFAKCCTLDTKALMQNNQGIFFGDLNFEPRVSTLSINKSRAASRSKFRFACLVALHVIVHTK